MAKEGGGAGWIFGIGAVIALIIFSQKAKAEEGGTPGPQGPQGPKGDRGTILTSGNDLSEAPVVALEGDYFLVIPTGDLYRYENGVWD